MTAPAAPAQQSPAAPGGPKSRNLAAVTYRYSMLGVLAILIVVASILYDGFLAPDNLRDILVQNASVGIIAVGMTFVIISGGFDLSVGATYALGSTVFAGVMISTNSIALAGVIALTAGVVCGLANGLLVARLKINPFVATLGSASVIAGIAYIYSNSAPFIVSDRSFQALANSRTLGVPTPILILLVTFTVGGLVLSKTTVGRNVQAVGGNVEAAWLSGLRVPTLTAGVYVLTGALAALAGMIDASRLAVGQADVGATMALDAIAIVVVGGTSLRGGEGAMWRSFVGLLILATLTNVFYSLNVSQHWQLIAKGLIVIAAVALDAAVRRKS
ncbi:ABC transporter permease [Mycolicibacterium neoaurum]|uniref:ABC transporter permease n=1 Tax=Mycolicibacterium neoaurum TaxID=1795 RepID=UPI00248BD581|nr:ABC transporter permease [Mycolicibacterium neoaurum]WBP95775.1 ABC transporter permease [Mycolicibacterium neoaurum]WBS09458.1 ABC transporter permease [Mycolicibacterium neoaurum]